MKNSILQSRDVLGVKPKGVVIYSNPQIFSPVCLPINWIIPRKVKTHQKMLELRDGKIPFSK